MASSQFIVSITEEDKTIESMAKNLNVGKSDLITLALNLLHHVLEQRKVGQHLTFTKDEDKTKNILEEAAAGAVKFSFGNLS